MFRPNNLVVVTAIFVLAGCAQLPAVHVRVGSAPQPAPFARLAVGDTPQAVGIAQRILKSHGSAADAAAALALGLAVTLPSVAGIGGGGECLVHEATGTTRVLRMNTLLPGLRVLQSTSGRLSWSQVVAPAERLARFGHPVSQALAKDLKNSAATLNDSAALTTFMNARRQLLQAGDALLQPALAETLARTRVGVSETSGDVPQWRDAPFADQDSSRVFALGGAQQGTAATSFVVGDSDGTVVACVLTMGRLFGAGKMQPGEGYLQADTNQVRAAALTATISVDRASGRVMAARAAGAYANTMDCAAQNELGTSLCTATADARGAGLAVVLSEGE